MPHGQEFENQPSPIKELEKQPTSSKIELQKANLNKYVTRSTPLAEIINWKLFVENRAKTPPNSLDDLLSDVEAELKFFTEVNGAFGESYHAIVDSILQNKERVPSLDPLIPEQRKRARQLSEALAFFELQIQREDIEDQLTAVGAILAKVELIEEQIHQLPVELRQDRLSQLRQLAEKEFRLALYMFFKPILEDVDLDRRTRDEFQERLSLLQDFLYVAMIKQKGADLSLLLLQQIASRA